jgi:hypothetical protein
MLQSRGGGSRSTMTMHVTVENQINCKRLWPPACARACCTMSWSKPIE